MAKYNKTNEEEKASLRVVMAGFPVVEKFKTQDEVEEYLHSEKIICLLCGRGLRILPNHLKKIHQTTTDEYKEMYGLPYTAGLTCLEVKQMAHINSTRVEHLEKLRITRNSENFLGSSRNKKNEIKRNSEYKSKVNRLNLSLITNRSRYKREDLLGVLNYMEEQQCSLKAAIKASGLSIRENSTLSLSGFRSILTRDEELSKLYKAIRSNMVKGNSNPAKYNPEFIHKIVNMEKAGMHYSVIAKFLGFSSGHINLILRKFKASEAQLRPDELNN